MAIKLGLPGVSHFPAHILYLLGENDTTKGGGEMEIAAVTISSENKQEFRFEFIVGSVTEHVALCHNLRRILYDLEGQNFDTGYTEWPLKYAASFSVTRREIEKGK